MLAHDIGLKARSVIAQAGLNCPAAIITDGKIQRFRMDGDTGKPCWYVAHVFGNGIVFIVFGCWKRGIYGTWCSHNINNLSLQEKELIKQQQEQIKREQQERQTKTKVTVRYIWEHAEQNFTEHAYLTRKQVKSFGLRLCKGNLLVPLYSESSELCSLQFITQEGEKRFKKDAPMLGCFFIIGEIDKTIYIAEGYATSATVHELTGCAVVVAFNAGNLLQVAQAIRRKYPDKNLIICADNDQWKQDNTGVQKATLAAQSVKAKLAIPQFQTTGTNKPTDWNDLMILQGIEEVRSQLENATVIKETWEEAVARLSQLTPEQYEQCRKEEAKTLKVRASFLDDSIKTSTVPSNTSSSETDDELENGIIPWHEPVFGAEVALEIRILLKQHVILNDEQITALTLFVFGTYCFDAFNVFPKLLVTSPTPRCGKSTLMAILSCVMHRTLMSSNTSPAAIFRAVDLWKPTLLIDEADSFLKGNEELRGVINSGHSKHGAYVLRVEGDSNNRTPKRFSTWSPMIIAMIKNPPGTILDRSIIIQLNRKAETEYVELLSTDCYLQLKTLRQKLRRWADDNFEALKCTCPQIPKTGNDRATDNWRPLFVIASLLGLDWTAKVTIAIQKLSSIEQEESIGTMLLCDIKGIFQELRAEKIHSDDLVARLIALENRPWAECRNGSSITKNTLAKMLKPFGIKSKQLWINNQNKYGYSLPDLQDAFVRYTATDQNAKTLGTNKDEIPGNNQNTRVNANLAFQKTLEPNVDAESSALAFQKVVIEGNINREVITL